MDLLTFDAVTPVVLAAVAFVIELPTGKIPNWLTLTGILTGIIVSFVEGNPAKHGLGMGLMGVIAITSWMQGWIPGGTAKLLIAMGTLAGMGGGLTCYGFVMLIPLYCLIFPPDEPRPSDPSRRLFPSTPMVLTGALIWAFVVSTNLLD